ncbi:MAG: formate/nitrite transporter family protein [Salinibacter sp.]|uniref:formate/nitrite transporter family protein n=1 Tax=Salinibacter sp. TaxID=2065818 RepID=UPI0035D4169D
MEHSITEDTESSEPLPQTDDGGLHQSLPVLGEVSGSPSNLRDALDRSESGAPAAGEALRDLFSTDEIFHRLVIAAEEEFSRSTRLLFLSGLAAGLSISLSFLGMAVLSALWPGGPSHLAGSLLYPLGFLLVVMGRYQLFTENTLTPVTLVLTRIASIPRLLHIWGVVLAANVLGAALCAYVLATTGVFTPEMAEVAHGIGDHFLEMSWADLFWKGVFAGWLVASMVWLNYAARSMTARILITFALIYPVAAAELAHCIVGSTEVLYVVFRGDASLWTFFVDFLSPTVLGNTVGGVLLVAILNFAQTRDRRFPHRDCGQLELTWTEWLFGHAAGRPESEGETGEEERLDVPVQPDDHVYGPSDAPVTIVQYGDYECPTSRRIYETMRQVMGALATTKDASGVPLQYVFRHLPLRQRHPHAVHAGVAAEAAARQGAFWEMHEQLFAHQDQLEDEDLRTYAAAIGLDLDQFEADLRDEALHDRVMADRSSAVQSGVRRTSNLFVDGKRYSGEFEPNAVLRAIRRRVAAERATDAQTEQHRPTEAPASTSG